MVKSATLGSMDTKGLIKCILALHIQCVNHCKLTN